MHTKEPWSIKDNGWCDETEVYDNQARIVACVNALAGVPIEHIEDGCYKKMKEDRDLLLQQRDELIEAMNLARDCITNVQYPLSAAAILSAAIEKAGVSK